jgi:hypothetical protein
MITNINDRGSDAHSEDQLSQTLSRKSTWQLSRKQNVLDFAITNLIAELANLVNVLPLQIIRLHFSFTRHTEFQGNEVAVLLWTV